MLLKCYWNFKLVVLSTVWKKSMHTYSPKILMFSEGATYILCINNCRVQHHFKFNLRESLLSTKLNLYLITSKTNFSLRWPLAVTGVLQNEVLTQFINLYFLYAQVHTNKLVRQVTTMFL